MTLDSVGGYRLVRRLGAGSRAEVFLGHTDRRDAVHRAVAIKIYLATTATESIEAELEALARADHPHCVRLLDVATDPHGRPSPVLERLPLSNLGRLLSERGTIDPGECVTIAVPIAEATGRLHEAGVAHGGIRLHSVGFNAIGAPVLARFGHVTVFEADTPAARVAEPSVIEDRVALNALIRTILDRTPGADSDGLADWLELVRHGGFPAGFETELVDRLFALAVASPVSFGASPGSTVQTLPGRLITASPAEPPANSTAETPPSRALSRSRARLDTLTGMSSGSGRLASILASFRAVRKPVWITAAAVALSLIVSLGLPVGEPADSASRANPTPAPTPEVRIPDGPVTGDDPLAALPVLLQARERCIEDLSVLCLDSVDQAGSAALSSDRELIRIIQGGGELPQGPSPTAFEATLVERLGNSALVDLGIGDAEATSAVLLMKGQHGWRIREFLP